MLVGDLKRPAVLLLLLGPWAALQRSPATPLEREVYRERPSHPPAVPLL